jgi:hypothetical protein
VSGHALSPLTAADAAAAAEVVVALEASLYGHGAFSQADLEAEWLELDLEQTCASSARCASSSRSVTRPTSTPPIRRHSLPSADAGSGRNRCESDPRKLRQMRL